MSDEADARIYRVIAHYGVAVVLRDDEGSHKRVPIRRGSPVLVGDRVRLESGTPTPLPAERVLRRRDRRGRVRRVAANLDAVGVVLSPMPATPDSFVDRAIVGARAGGMEPFVVVNKIDLEGGTDLAERVRAVWPDLSAVCAVSAETGAGLDGLAEYLGAGRLAAFVGVSGVGKSSLLNALGRDVELVVGEINEQSGLGRHVTTNATLHALPGGGELIDTPGFRDFGPVDVGSRELAAGFPGFERALAVGCRYRDCRHVSEPGCAVLLAVEAGDLSANRHAAYLELLRELEAVEAERR